MADENPIEQIMKDLNKMLGKSGGSGKSGGDNGGSGVAFSVVILIILTVVGVMTSYYTVDQSEEHVITRLGAFHKVSPPGLHFKMPFGIDSNHPVKSQRLIQQEFGFRTKDVSGPRTTYRKYSNGRSEFDSESLMVTGDLNVADVEWVLQYRISDPFKYLFHTRDVDKNLRDISISIMRRVVGDMLVGDVLTTGRSRIAAEAETLTQEVIDKFDMGVRIDSVILQSVNPPIEVRKAFNEVNEAKQEQEETINKAERQYNNVIPEARGKAEKSITEATAYGAAIINEAKGNAARFTETLKAYRVAPKITRKRLYLEAMEEIYGKLDRFTVIDSQLKGILPLYPGSGVKLAPQATK